ncbi:alpha-E domain-containing protein [Jannaschia sp. 2305UL9-9]|uniref:alpha-E domain-containing protein n=1 Tax=Jannaschia sp. 2305UL9-9 TaxID=3121638 RepID=UPI003527009B
MLGKTAGSLYWMFRYLERAENLARLIETGQRMALTRPDSSDSEWSSILATAGVRRAFEQVHDEVTSDLAIDFLLRSPDNSSSVLGCIDNARTNARTARTALTREIWEAVNECWMTLRKLLARRIATRDLPHALATIRARSAFVRGALHGTMLRDDAYDFARIGTFIERADATARLLDVKYFVLLPSVAGVGSRLDNAQWEMILRAVSAEGAFRAVHGNAWAASSIAEFLILDGRMPRSLAFCYSKIGTNLAYLEQDYGIRQPCHDRSDAICRRLENLTIEAIFEEGLHRFLQDFLAGNAALGQQVEQDFRFTR